jgi:hypothetical protein
MTVMASPPAQTSLIELDDKVPSRRLPFYLSKAWLLWLYDLILRVQSALQLLQTVTLVNQHAAIGATSIALGGVSAGILRLAWYLRVTTRDPVSSSVTLTIAWTEGAQACTLSGAAVAGNLVTSLQSGVIEIAVDSNAVITYATAYASNTPGVMQYSLRISVTKVN